MTLGIFLSLGDSLNDLSEHGQLSLFKEFYIKPFSRNFEMIYIFSYDNERVHDLPSNVVLIPNFLNLHRYLYTLLLPFINFKTLIKCDVIRVYHLTGVIPAIITKILLRIPFLFNYAYPYLKFALIEKKYFQLFSYFILKPIGIFFSSKIFAANKDILRILPSNKKVYLPNGVDTSFFKPSNKKLNNKLTVLSVGRLEKQKNYENLIESAKDMNINLVIIGRGSLKRLLVQKAKENKVNLKIIDKVSHEKMPGYYNKADLFVLPSLAEGHSKVLLEAMSCQLPVVASNVDGTKDVLNKFNGIKTSTDIVSIKKSLDYLVLNKSLRQTIGINARKTVIKNFNLGELIRKEIKVIKSVAR